MFRVDVSSNKSIYQQVVDNIKDLVVKGVLKPKTKLPSVREMSRILTVNPNTIQKAYKELENQGFVYKAPGLGSFIADIDDIVIDISKFNRIKRDFKANVFEFGYFGLSDDDIRDLLNEILAERSQLK